MLTDKVFEALRSEEARLVKELEVISEFLNHYPDNQKIVPAKKYMSASLSQTAPTQAKILAYLETNGTQPVESIRKAIGNTHSGTYEAVRKLMVGGYIKKVKPGVYAVKN